MANVNDGTYVRLNQIPTGFTVVDRSFSDPEWSSEEIELSVLKATVEDATPATTLTNIIEDLTIGIDKQVNDLISAVSTDGVTIYTELLALTTNLIFSEDLYKNVAPSYKCTVKYYYKTT
jgi:hypothetical protein